MEFAEQGKEIEIDLENQIIFSDETQIATFEIDPFQKMYFRGFRRNRLKPYSLSIK